jgi:probable O-glycosylation ligase (exosortase A-associated)
MFRGVIVRLIVIVAVPLSFLNPFNGVLWYLWYSHFRPNDFVWPQWAFKIGAWLLAGATLSGYVLFEMHHSPPRWRGLVLMTMFFLWIALTTALATDKATALWKLSQYVHILIMTFLVAALATSEERIKAMLTVMGVSVGVLGARATTEFLLTGGQFKVQGVGGVELEGNEFALALNMGFTILMGLSYLEKRRWLRYTFRILALFCITAVVGTFSRSGFLGLSIALLLVAWYSKRRVTNLVLLAVAAVALLPFIPQKALQRWKSIPTAAELDPSAIARIQTWETGLQMIKHHPIFGVGPSNFQEQYSHYFLQKYMDAVNYHPRAPHNAYVCLAAESGIPGMLLFVSFVVATIIEMWRFRRKLLHVPRGRDLAGYCLIVQITLMVFLIPNFFISRQNEDLMWHLVGINAGLAAVVRHLLSDDDPDGDQIPRLDNMDAELVIA